ncbi:MAG: ribosome assembly RNA-binding protein YhbY [Gammaproteobacteria bacterium]|jgi:RNA-binding protein|nr:ribosome assembly RNA-binding protein YhbY [Gammaproteobacteria bacterium]MBT3488366.1 ribosome assembly RNA-binding protein YhbY [Gammaproteobacteria bacterium]MBT3719443.1 ribosome assembly RNA-binding protein YhbY [Gammaproteobacteria bacterium]MBT3845600.1 ribosome assembly RNA-binding protein YhbY [Gammaproteobacteria bacterium]MBT3894130.1 ribosome assembly RNA-binding protein YhbY [Gammaproteobacteria bacterium]
MDLTGKQKRHLRGLGHELHPLVTIGGNGLSESVLSELNQTLEHHELIKVKVNAGERDEKKVLIAEMVEKSKATLVQTIGHVALLYRRAEQPKLQLPK